ncbi:phosphotransferase enzyme family-domain-containing protein [Durotheca rogersii]|uniref:phosphotransferase enzyme family-domain-containing protein n=1 Tax=Durotheca rogersii TaxID=419775 RepID=UPI00221F526C|nr:phosphotransferase enzyme family-domain-containing protein [Durotheca rogersii]KAI5856690.1 phosphotransferase enzyme family-domain-containing protein [Durotheca rogersii]
MPRPSQDGLGWKETLFDLQLAIPPEDPCTVAFHASGLFNQPYTVKCARGSLIMRVSLPVYPRHKTRAEVATLRWVRENTKVPVPKVLGFDNSNDNEIGYEWILTELIQGASAHKRWRTMSMEQKVALTKRIATSQVQLLGPGKPGSVFRSIGTLDLREVVPGLLVFHEGPFRSSHDWLSAELNIILLHQTAVLGKTEGEDDREDAEEVLFVARKLLSLIPKVFLPTSDESERTGLYHHDLHLNNILECVSALPPWMSTKVPKFPDGPVREREPQRGSYVDETPEESAAAAGKRNDPGYLGSDGKGELYFVHRMGYEATQLRKVYEARLRELWLEWPLEESYVKIDFFQAISQCDGIWAKRTRRWADCNGEGRDCTIRRCLIDGRRNIVDLV